MSSFVRTLIVLVAALFVVAPFLLAQSSSSTGAPHHPSSSSGAAQLPISSSSASDPGCYDGQTISVVHAIENECQALNNITGLQSFCNANPSGAQFIQNNNNGVTYKVACPPSNGTDDATGIYVLPGGTLTITAFTQFTPSNFSNNTLNDFWCSGFRSYIEGGTINGGNCTAGINTNGACTTPLATNALNSNTDFRNVVVGGATADDYCSFAGGEGHPLLYPSNQSYSTMPNYLYINPAWEYPQGALVYRIGDVNPSGGSAYLPLYTGVNVTQGASLSTGVGSYSGYSGGNTPYVNAATPANALIDTITIPTNKAGQVYLCFWDYYNADNFGNIHVQVTYHPPLNSPLCGVRGDPQFIGLRGQQYQVHGIDGGVYNLITDSDIQLNARFAYLSKGVCPKKPKGAKATACWSHPGSYLSEIVILQRIGNDLHKVRLIAGPASKGFETVLYNDHPLSIGATVYETASATKTGRVAFSVTVIDEFTVQLITPKFAIEFENSDMFINQAIRSHSRKLTSHGLIGQTWSTKTYNSDVKYVEGDIDDYLLPSGDLEGTDFPFNKF